MNTMRLLLRKVLPISMLAGAAVILGAGASTNRDGDDGGKGQTTLADLAVARIFFEYNSSDNDLGVHVFLDGEDWNKLKIVNPNGLEIFEVKAKGGYHDLGLTEMFFEGAEPSLDEVPLEALLALFPEGVYRFSAKTVEEGDLVSAATFSHAVPAGPDSTHRSALSTSSRSAGTRSRVQRKAFRMNRSRSSDIRSSSARSRSRFRTRRTA